MAEITVPTGTGNPASSAGLGVASWLDRPLFPAWQRVVALVAHWEIIAYVALVLLGLILRLWDVGGRAMHHDESLHAYYSWRFYSGQGYSYDPLMHGPLQFEVVPLFYLLFGVSDFSARLFAVVLGTALIFLPYFLRSHLTRPGALLAAAMLTISPAFVYFSRFIRDDIYLACFSLILFIVIVRYLESPRPYLLYIGAASMALAMASMEAAYITFFIFGTFLIFEALREYIDHRDGPVLSALRATSLDTWLTALSIFIIINVVLYSSFFTNPYGIWDTRYPLTSPNRKDILGGLLYWKEQHYVQRGGQPWFYYLLVLPMYEQLAVLFGLAGIAYAVARRSLVRTFMVWWAVLALGLYSWAGEKMPWLSIHIALPLILLAGLGLGAVLQSSRRVLLALVSAVFALLLAVEIHSTFLLNYVDAANPTEMLIYVQTSPDVPNVVHEITALSQRRFGGDRMSVGLDTTDVGGWPFIWYLRNWPNITETSTFTGPVCNGQYCPVLLMLDSNGEYTQASSTLQQHYVIQKYRWNWWFPEDYKTWFPQQWSVAWQNLQGKGSGSFISNLLGTSTDWSHVWDWLVYRQPFGYRGARWLYVGVRRDLVPGAKNYAASGPGASVPESPPAPHIQASTLPAALAVTMGSSGVGAGHLDGPRGIAAGPNGNLYVADTLNHRIAEYSAGGAPIRSWGGPGAAHGQFSAQDSPQGLGVGPDGSVYVADTWNQRIEVFSSSGHYLRSWGSPTIGSALGYFYGPRSVAVSSDGRVYIADTGNRRIQVFTTQGRYLFSFGSAGTGTGQFQEPSSVAIGPGGLVYVSDFWNQRIQVFAPDGTYLRQWSVPDWRPQSYDEPYLAVDPRTGNIVATDPQQQRVLVFTSNGRLLGSFGRFSVPIGVTVLPNGRVAVSDATANHVGVFVVRESPGVRRTPAPGGDTRSRRSTKKP